MMQGKRIRQFDRDQTAHECIGKNACERRFANHANAEEACRMNKTRTIPAAAIAWLAAACTLFVAPCALSAEAAPTPSFGVGQAIDAAAAEVAAAEKALAEAKRRLAEGEEPLPGERTGIAGSGGRSRLNETYFKRQEALKKAVEDAEKRLEQANARRNAARG